MTSGFSVQLDDRDVRELLDRFTEPEVKKLLRKASTKAGAAMKRAVGPAIPVGKTGNLAGALSARRIRSNPSIGVVVGPMGRKASHRHLVAGGTKPHVIRPKHRTGRSPRRLASPRSSTIPAPGRTAGWIGSTIRRTGAVTTRRRLSLTRR